MIQDKEVRNPRREGWFARDCLRKTQEAAERAVAAGRYAIPFYPAPPYPPGTPEREEWNLGWKDLDEALRFRETHPDTLMGFSLPPHRRYRCAHCGAIYESLFHCQTLPVDGEQFLEFVEAKLEGRE